MDKRSSTACLQPDHNYVVQVSLTYNNNLSSNCKQHQHIHADATLQCIQYNVHPLMNRRVSIIILYSAQDDIAGFKRQVRFLKRKRTKDDTPPPAGLLSPTKLPARPQSPKAATASQASASPTRSESPSLLQPAAKKSRSKKARWDNTPAIPCSDNVNEKEKQPLPVVTSIHYIQSCTRLVGPQAQTEVQRPKTRDRTIIEKYIRETDVVLG